MPFLGNFGLEFQKPIIIFEINTLEFVCNKFLTYATNFGIRSIFPGFAFSKGLGLGSAPKRPYLNLGGIILEVTPIEFV